MICSGMARPPFTEPINYTLLSNLRAQVCAAHDGSVGVEVLICQCHFQSAILVTHRTYQKAQIPRKSGGQTWVKLEREELGPSYTSLLPLNSGDLPLNIRDIEFRNLVRLI